MAFPRFTGGPNQNFGLANTTNYTAPFPPFAPPYPVAAVAIYNPNTVTVNNHYQFSYPPQPRKYGFKDYLLQYTLSKNLRFLSELRRLIQEASKEDVIYSLENYFNQVLSFNNFENDRDKNYFLISLLDIFFKNMSEIQLAHLLINHGENLFEYLLSLKSVPLLQLYLAQLRALLLNKSIHPQQYVNIVLNPKVDLLFFHNRAAALSLSATYLAEVSEIIKRGLIKWSLAAYLRLLLDLSADVSLGETESENIKTGLNYLKAEYETKQLSREAYLHQLNFPDKQGMTVLHKVIILNNQEIFEAYLKALSEVGQPDEIENLALHLSNENYSFLHGLAFLGKMPALNLFINFLRAHLGEERTKAILVQQAGTENSYGQLPYYAKGQQDEPMNYFISLLQNNMATEALDYLDTCRDLEEVEAKLVTLSPKRFCFPNSMFFFSENPGLAFEAKEEPPELKEGEVYLPSGLLKMLNSPT